jgi:hypothetical protein
VQYLANDFKGKEIKEKYKFNKMLFYFWKNLEKQGFGDSYIIDEFVSGRAGPIPKNLKESMIRLEKKGGLCGRNLQKSSSYLNKMENKEGEKFWLTLLFLLLSTLLVAYALQGILLQLL